MSNETSKRDTVIALFVCGLLLLAVILVYAQAARHAFVNFDDNEYVYENPHVLAGLTWNGVAWAFTNHDVSSQWQPMTLLSLMADAEFSGVNGASEHSRAPDDSSSFAGAKTGTGAAKTAKPAPADLARLAGRMHSVNVALHAANVLLVFWVLRAMTNAMWRSATVAAIFAVHPLHVESVAWITERKDVLCGFFGLLTLAAYVWYARRPSPIRYLMVAAAMALGLMCKPMLVTWPIVFLLLDYWPLGRWGRAGSEERGAGSGQPSMCSPRMLVTEKMPLLAIAAGFATVAFWAQWSGHAVKTLESVSIYERLCRAAMLYVTYVGKTLWPANLAVHYPVEPLPSYWPASAAVALLALVTVTALRGARRGQRWLVVGWLWFLLTLAPTIGLVQVGTQVRADRFMYLPQIGLCLAGVWGVASVFVAGQRRHGRVALATVLFLAGCAVCAWGLTACWRDGVTLWSRAIASTSRNSIAEYNLGVVLRDNGKASEAIPHLRKAVEIDGNFVEARNNLCVALADCERYDEAITEYRKVLAIKPDMATPRYDYGNVLARRGQYEAAIEQYRLALALEPHNARLHHNLAVALLAHGETEAAVAEYKKALAIEPDDAKYCGNLAEALERAGQKDEALAEYRKAVELANAQGNKALAEQIEGRIGRRK
jgi:Flp pilus assembly protein TadD